VVRPSHLVPVLTVLALVSATLVLFAFVHHHELTSAPSSAPQAENVSAPDFQLIDQYGRPVSLASLHGKTFAITLLDDVCTSDCPIIAQEFRAADQLLGSAASHVELVAINGNPRFITPNYLRAFDQQEGLTSLSNWLYLTGSSLTQLQRVWRSFGMYSAYLPGGAMVDHSEFAEVIDGGGQIRYLLSTDPGAATAVTKSSFAETLAQTIRKALGPA
jgi:cytochrome oxidase Cu insertion factor (SCO1/SenC/PrrC family)